MSSLQVPISYAISGTNILYADMPQLRHVWMPRPVPMYTHIEHGTKYYALAMSGTDVAYGATEPYSCE
eukprot:352079-Rhodomonas_salina.2